MEQTSPEYKPNYPHGNLQPLFFGQFEMMTTLVYEHNLFIFLYIKYFYSLIIDFQLL